MCAIDFSHGGNIYEIERKYNKEVIDFSANINPLGLSREVKESICKNLDRILHYPPSNTPDLIKKIADYWEISKKNILLGNGSAELIYLIVTTFNPKTALIPAPTFSEYERAVKSVDSKVSFLKLNINNSFKLNLSSVRKKDIFFLCHPNNPTGNFILKNNVETIKRLADRLVIVDEAFMDFIPNQWKYSFIKKTVKIPKMVVLRTFTKMFALPGLRIGYMVGHEEIIRKLKNHQPPWSTNSLAQLAAEISFENKEYIRKTNCFVEKERKFLFNEIADIRELTPYPSLVNFLLIKLNEESLTSSNLKQKLISKGILIRNCANFRGLNNKFIRIAVRSHEENVRLIQTLKKVL